MTKKGQIMFNKLFIIVWMWAFFFASALARKQTLHRFSEGLMRLFAWLSLFIKKGKKQSSLGEAVLEWQRMFPSKKINRIKAIGEDTAYAEVRIHCPLRGTGDVLACYRLMEYDRAMLRKIGGQLIVLRSQAEPDVTFCEVALRLQGVDTNDLIPAHERV